MTKYIVSFNDGDMDFPVEDFPAVGAAAHAVMRDAIDAGVWVFGGGFQGFSPFTVTGQGIVNEGPLQPSPVHLGGFAILDCSSREEVIHWAARIAESCRCTQEIREFMDDPEQDEYLKSKLNSQ